jgi:2-octaprenyl-6-methoxyphenol hydroxylase
MGTLKAEVAVIGGGPAGLTAATALAAGGVETVLIAKPTPRDNRTTALFAGSVAALEALGVWEACRARAAPLGALRIVDATRRLLRAPEVKFSAEEIGLDAFGYNIENRHLLAALETHADTLAALTRVAESATSVEPGPNDISVTLADHRAIQAKLVVGADGRHSLCRAAAGITTQHSSYPQQALTVNLSHTRPHHDTSTEFHTETGPFTLVPLPGKRSSLVCVLDPATAERLGALDDAELSAEIERRSHSILGKVSVEPGRGLFPLAVGTARCVAANRIALVGEAAHVIPPIGAQGLNLGLRDAATIGETVIAAHRAGGDIGAAAVTDEYDRRRQADVGSRTLAVDLLNRILLTDFLPVQGLRGLGLYMLDQISPLRRAVMREGVQPAAAQPRLMRGEVL